jgi:hypothetical protein
VPRFGSPLASTGSMQRTKSARPRTRVLGYAVLGDTRYCALTIEGLPERIRIEDISGRIEIA